MEFVSYSAGAYTRNGQTIGWEGKTRDQAQEAFDLMCKMTDVASVEAYGWDSNDEPELILSWVNDSAS